MENWLGFRDLKPGDKIRILEPRVRHTHYMLDQKTMRTQVLCLGESCPICKMAKSWKKVSWYRKVWGWIEKLLRRKV